MENTVELFCLACGGMRTLAVSMRSGEIGTTFLTCFRCAGHRFTNNPTAVPPRTHRFFLTVADRRFLRSLCIRAEE